MDIVDIFFKDVEFDEFHIFNDEITEPVNIPTGQPQRESRASQPNYYYPSIEVPSDHVCAPSRSIMLDSADDELSPIGSALVIVVAFCALFLVGAWYAIGG